MHIIYLVHIHTCTLYTCTCIYIHIHICYIPIYTDTPAYHIHTWTHVNYTHTYVCTISKDRNIAKHEETVCIFFTGNTFWDEIFESTDKKKCETYRLTSPPSVIKFLSPSKMESGIKHRIIHWIANNSMWFWIQPLCVKEYLSLKWHIIQILILSQIFLSWRV